MMVIGGSLFSAFAFSGTNFLFSLFGDHGKTEMKRHNLAMERFTKARDNYNKERQQRLDYKNKTMREQVHAKQTFNDLGVNMQNYNEVTREPKFSEYYNPSRQQKDGEIVFIAGGMTLLGVLAYKYM